MDMRVRKLTPDEINTVARHLEKVTKNQQPGCLCGTGNWQVFPDAVCTPLWSVGRIFGNPVVPAVMVYCGSCGEIRQINPTAIPIDLSGDQGGGGEAEEVEVLEPVEEENVT